MAKNKVTGIQEGPDAPVGTEAGTNQGVMSGAELAALEAAKATAGEPLAVAAATAPVTTKADDKKTQGQKVKVLGLRIKAKSGTFRRAGLTFGEQPVEMLFAELSKEQVTALKEEPLLSVEQITIEIEA